MKDNTIFNTVTGNKRETDFTQYEDMFNRVLMADSYKYSHPWQYPSESAVMFDYAEARSNKNYDKTLFNGLQPKLKRFFVKPIQQWEVDEAYMYAQAHGIKFAIDGWDYIVQTLGGNLPVEIKAIPEGTAIKTGLPLFSIKSTDEKVYWVASWLETSLMTNWKTSNVGTRAYYVRLMLEEFAEKTQDNPFVAYQFVNFGARGASNPEDARDTGVAHLIAGFMGSDNFSAIREAHRMYNVEDINTIMHSISATEHSSTTAWTKEREMEMIMNHLENCKGEPLCAAVCDSYDYLKCVDVITEENGDFQKKINSDEYPTFVIRPDSGDSAKMVMETLTIMERNNVPYTTNKKGFKVFNKMRIIWGDGIDMEAMRIMLTILMDRGYSSENISFGSGGWLTSDHNRDTQGWAIKLSQLTLKDGTNVDVFKDPITAPNKKSKKGEITTSYNTATKEYRMRLVSESDENGYFSATEIDAMAVVYRNSKMVKEYTLAEARANNQKVPNV